jgi:uncharacterized membrane protein YdjX (TVP38/TMEM64 family)
MLEGSLHRDVESRDDAPRPGRPRPSVTRLLPFALLALGFALFFILDLDRYLSLDALRNNRQALVDWVERAGSAAWAVYIGAYALVIALSLPGGALMTIIGGFLFGPLIGSVLTVIGATTGATGLFLAARYAFADYLRAKSGPAIRRMEAGFHENALSYLLFLRLVPVFPFWLVNLVPALLGVRLGTFVLATAIGIVPGTVVYALVGDGLGAVLDTGGKIDLRIIYEPRFLLPIVGLAILALLPVVYKKLRRPR